MVSFPTHCGSSVWNDIGKCLLSQPGPIVILSLDVWSCRPKLVSVFYARLFQWPDLWPVSVWPLGIEVTQTQAF